MRKRIIALAMAIVCTLGAPAACLADEIPTEVGDSVVIDEGDKPYLSLGADLTAEQQHTVLDLMGIDSADLDQYDVSYVNNKEEHEYLDAYISSKKIGKRALSSVVIVEGKKNQGLNISTYNINYCTVGMYKNALATAGITDADIIVAGPFEISGTAALVGIMKAYTQMTGEEIHEDIVDAALDELVTTGELEESLGDNVSKEDVEAVIAEIKKEVAEGKLDTQEDIIAAIKRIAGKYGITFTEDQIQQILSLIEKLKGLDLDWNKIKDQADYWAKKLGGVASKVTPEDVDGFMGILRKIIDAILGFFSGFAS